MKNKNKIKYNLKQHLIDFGFKFFNNYYEYDIWKDNYFYKSDISVDIKKKYLTFLEKNLSDRNYRLCNDFYDLIAEHKKLMLITHSMKSNEILNSGLSVINELKENSNVLDIGCNSAYLTSFYSKVLPKTKFIGFDRSKNSILQASKISYTKQYSNLVLSYNYNILNKYKFNFITDTQCLCTLKEKELLFILDLLKNQVHSNVRIISISNLGNEKHAESFLNLFLKNNLFVESISPLFIETLNGLVAYTKIIFTKKQSDIKHDLRLYFNNIRKKISIVNLFNLN